MLLSMIVLALAVLMIGIGMLRYRKRSVAKNITSVVVIIASAVVSCVVARLIALPIGNLVVETIANKSPELYTQLMTDLPVTASVVPLLVAMIAAPILFVVAMLVIRPIFAIVGIFVAKGLSSINGFFKNPNLAVNLSLAVIGGLLIVSIYTAPLIGLTGAVDSVVDAMPAEFMNDETASIDIAEVEETYIGSFVDSPITQTVYFFGGKPVFNSLTSYSAETGTKLSLSNDIPVIASAITPIVDIAGTEMSEYGPEEADKIRSIPDYFEDSALLRVIGAEVFGALSDAWLEGEAFMGIERPEGGDVLDEVIDGLLEIFADTDEENFPGDLSAVTDTIAVLAETGLLAELSKPESDILSLLEQEGTLATIFDAVYSNENAHPILSALFNVSVGTLSDAIGIYSTPEEAAESLADALAELSLEDITEEEMTEEVIKIRDTYNVNWTDEQCAAVAAQMKASPYGQPTTRVSGGVALLAGDAASPKSMSGKSDYDQKRSWLDGIVASASQQSNEEIPPADPNLVTKQDLKLVSDQIKDIDKASIDKLANSLPGVIEALSGTNADGSMTSNSAELIELVGPILDAFHTVDASSGSADNTSYSENLLVGIMQSEKGQNITGMTPKESGKVVVDVIDGMEEDGSNFTDTTKQVNHLVTMINKSTEEKLTIDDETLADAKALIADMNKSSATLLKSMFNETLLTNVGMKESSAEAVSVTISNLVDSIMACKEGLSEEEYDHEAEAVCSLLHIFVASMNTTDEFVGLFDGSDNSGRLDMTTEELVDKIVSSDILVGTLTSSSDVIVNGEDSFSLAGSLTESDKTEMAAALEAAKLQHPDRLDAIEVIADIFGV